MPSADVPRLVVEPVRGKRAKGKDMSKNVQDIILNPLPITWENTEALQFGQERLGLWHRRRYVDLLRAVIDMGAQKNRLRSAP